MQKIQNSSLLSTPKNIYKNTPMYDLAIIGAGINGASMAFAFAEKKVILFDPEGIAHGGSGAAGAFIAPKFSKKGELKELLHDAFLFSMEYYEKNFPQFLTKALLLHIAQNEEDSLMLKEFKKQTALQVKTPPKELLDQLLPHAKVQENICLDAGVVAAREICKAMSKEADFKKEKVQSLVYADGVWCINETYFAKNVILATGAYEAVLQEPYINLRGIWGHRIDIKTSTKNKYSIHQYLSISPSKEGILALGATHDVHYHPQKNIEPYDIHKGRAELLEKAAKTMLLEDIEIVQDYTGLRSGSVDYMPLAGGLVMSQETLACKNINFENKKPNFEQYTYYPNLYVLNGSAGYGFVLAPYLAKILSEHILNATEIDKKLLPARFFARWARRR